MLRMSKLTDYATMVLAELARVDGAMLKSADVAARTGLTGTTVSKLLKSLTRAGLVNSHRGARGGYELAKAPDEISAAEVIVALEGPVAITECSTDEGNCDLESVCRVGGAWQRINLAIYRALQDISLAELIGGAGASLSYVDLRSVTMRADGGRAASSRSR
jgi:FeS assembly SUF system regulator